MRTAAALFVALDLCATQSVQAATAQQEKMKTCNADATTQQLKGDARKAFMKNCLSASGSASARPLTPQQQKMSTCSKDAAAKNLKGDDRKKFMSDCLKAT
jgi:hypothetical protein